LEARIGHAPTTCDRWSAPSTLDDLGVTVRAVGSPAPCHRDAKRPPEEALTTDAERAVEALGAIAHARAVVLVNAISLANRSFLPFVTATNLPALQPATAIPMTIPIVHRRST